MKTSNLVVATVGAIIRVVVVIAAIYFIYVGSRLCYNYGYRIFTEPAVSKGEGKKVTVAVTEQMNPFEIGNLFESKGLVRDARLFGLQYYLSEYRKEVKPGTFELSTAMTAEEMMEVMSGVVKETDESEE